ncbi:hypothetical protein [Streptomyces sp. NPDC001828]|uniref:hypothetical protein n=1 Tax=Streptomyces sp. NPDC001828 TaxID=3364615 RepID=UPI0036A7107A
MSQHVKRDRSTRPRFLGAAVTGVALLLGGAFAAQAAADTGPKPAAPKAATSGDSAPAVSTAGGGASGAAKATGASGAAKVTGAGKGAGADKGAGVAEPAAGSSSDVAPKVIKPGSGVGK